MMRTHTLPYRRGRMEERTHEDTHTALYTEGEDEERRTHEDYVSTG